MAPPIHPPTRKLLTAVALATAPLVVAACGSNGSGGTVAIPAGDGGDDDASVQVGPGMGTLAIDGGAPDDGAVIMMGTVVLDAGNLLDAGDDAADTADAADGS